MKIERDLRTEILDKAEKLIAEKGYASTKVEDITNECGIAKGSFYTYFKTKEEVLIEIFKSKEYLYNIKIEEVASKNLVPIEKMKFFTKKFYEFFIENRQFYALAFKLLDVPKKEIFSEVKKIFLKKMFQNIFIVEQILLECIEKGKVADKWLTKSCELSNMYIGMIEHHLRFLIFKQANPKDIMEGLANISDSISLANIDIEKEAEFLTEAFLEGVLKRV